MKKFVKIVILSGVLLLIFAFSFSVSLAAYIYTPMEKIPGFGIISDFPTYISSIYKFAVWTVGIAALLMLSIGGFMYLTSAGNNARMEKAKGVITDSVFGVVMVMTAYLLLYVLNPDLVGGNISSLSSSRVSVASSNISSLYTPVSGIILGDSWPGVLGMSNPPGTLLDANARTTLTANGISVNNPDCTNVGQSGCTSLDWIPQKAIDGVVKIKQIQYGGTSLAVIVTGGTEYWLHKTHGPEKGVVDIYVSNVVPSDWDNLLPLIVGQTGATKAMCDNGTFLSPSQCGAANHIHVVF